MADLEKASCLSLEVHNKSDMDKSSCTCYKTTDILFCKRESYP